MCLQDSCWRSRKIVVDVLLRLRPWRRAVRNWAILSLWIMMPTRLAALPAIVFCFGVRVVVHHQSNSCNKTQRQSFQAETLKVFVTAVSRECKQYRYFAGWNCNAPKLGNMGPMVLPLCLMTITARVSVTMTSFFWCEFVTDVTYSKNYNRTISPMCDVFAEKHTISVDT